MELTPGFERLVQWAKRLQRRALVSDYADVERHYQWTRPKEDSPFSESLHPLPLDASSWKSLLIYKPDDIGDAVFSLPALTVLRETLPGTRFFLVCQAKTAPLYARTRIFDEIGIGSTKMRFGRLPRFGLNEALSNFSQTEFDAGIYLRTYPSYFRSFLKVPAPIKIHPRDPRMKSRSVYQPRISLWGNERLHQVQQLYEIIEPIVKRPLDFSHVTFPEFHWTDDDKKAIEIAFPKGRPEKFLVVHPFAPVETRRYPPEHWKSLLSRLTKRLPIVMIGGANDSGESTVEGVISVRGKLSLGQSGYLISQSSGFIGNESGPLHWAGAMGRPAVGLFGGHSLPREWAPVGNSKIFRLDVPCAPCHQKVCPGYGLACLKELRPDAIFPELVQFLQL